jgi:hypothetical protein
MAEKKKIVKIHRVSNTPVISNEEIELRAYFLWEGRGKPLGSPEEDWYQAAEELRTEGNEHGLRG